MADDAGVPAVFFWQPIKNPIEEYMAIAELLPAGVIDITDAYDDVEGDIFIDGGHTNEVGAEAVAEEIYDWIEPQLSAFASGRTGS